jgi:Mg-chelatase subunit ChlD
MRIRTAFLQIIIVWILVISGQPVWAQSLNLNSRTVDFGNVAAVQIPAKTVEFTNISKDRIAILVVEKGPDVKVGYEHRFYEPGEKGSITLSYQPEKLGSFSEEVRVFTSLDNEPYILTLKGNGITLEECFPNKANMNLRNVMVVNKVTQDPVPWAGVTFVHNFDNTNPLLCKTDKTGKAIMELPIGQYHARSAVEGFETYEADFFIPRSQPNVLIELTPLKKPLPFMQVAVPQVAPKTTDSAALPKPVVTSADLPEDRYAANNIVLLLDVSSSMRQNNKFTLLQQAVNNLVMILRPIDNVSIITYAGDAKVVLKGVPGSEKEKIMGVVQELNPVGITQGVKGLNTAYELATRKFIEKGNNQIILATDGEFSEKNITDEYYQQLIGGYAAKGIKLSILGFGINEQAISRMKMMTTYGKGSYIHIGTEQYIKDVLINEIKSKSFMAQ